MAVVLAWLYLFVALGVAVVLYLFLYHNFVPIISFHRGLYFDFRYVPWAWRGVPAARHTCWVRTH